MQHAMLTDFTVRVFFSIKDKNMSLFFFLNHLQFIYFLLFNLSTYRILSKEQQNTRLFMSLYRMIFINRKKVYTLISIFSYGVIRFLG